MSRIVTTPSIRAPPRRGKTPPGPWAAGGRWANGVPPAASDEPPVDQERDGPGDSQADDERTPEQRIADARLHRPWDGDGEPVVDGLHRHDRDGVGGQRRRHRAAWTHPTPHKRDDRERVAEDEREPDGQDQPGQEREPQRGRDDDPDDLADGAAGEAMGGRASGETRRSVTRVDHQPRILPWSIWTGTQLAYVDRAAYPRPHDGANRVAGDPPGRGRVGRRDPGAGRRAPLGEPVAS